MRISDSERREVAGEIRQFLSRPLDEQAVDNDRLQTVGRLVRTSVGENILVRLADLIDRPTCHIRETDHEFEDSVRCDRCQMTFNRPWEPFKFCPNCGAEVKDEAEPSLKEN